MVSLPPAALKLSALAEPCIRSAPAVSASSGKEEGPNQRLYRSSIGTPAEVYDENSVVPELLKCSTESIRPPSATLPENTNPLPRITTREPSGLI